MEKIDQQLLALARGNEEYAVFNKRIVNTSKQVYGVRVPDLRKLARQLSKDLGSDDIARLMESIDQNIFEHVMLIGLIINNAKITDAEKILPTKKYLIMADSWALIDVFVSKMKKFDRQLYWNYAVKCLASNKEFTVRYGVIMMMANYLNPDDIDNVLNAIRRIKHTGYYVKMAAAWLYATAAVDFFGKILQELESPEIDPWTRKKALQKMLESYRFSDSQKQNIRSTKGQITKA